MQFLYKIELQVFSEKGNTAYFPLPEFIETNKQIDEYNPSMIDTMISHQKCLLLWLKLDGYKLWSGYYEREALDNIN